MLWGYVEVAGMVGRMSWDDVLDDAFDLSGSATRLGHQPQLELKFGVDSTTLRACNTCTARASRTT